MAEKKPLFNTSDRNAVMLDTWKSVHELKAGLKRTEEKIASVKNIRLDSLFCSSPNKYQVSTTKLENSDEIQNITARILNDDRRIKQAMIDHQFKQEYTPNLPKASSAISDISSINSEQYKLLAAQISDIDTNSNVSSIKSVSKFTNPDYVAVKTAWTERPKPPVHREKLKKLIEEQAAKYYGYSNDFNPLLDDYVIKRSLHHEEEFVSKSTKTPWLEQSKDLDRKPAVRKIAHANGPLTYKGFSTKKPFISAINGHGESPTKKRPNNLLDKAERKPTVKIRKIAQNPSTQKKIITPSSWKCNELKDQKKRPHKNEKRKTLKCQDAKNVSRDNKLIEKLENGRTTDLKLKEYELVLDKDLKNKDFEETLKFINESTKPEVKEEAIETRERRNISNLSSRALRKSRWMKKKNSCPDKKTKERAVNYDLNKVREYIDKKKLERKKMFIQEKNAKSKEAQLKQERLKELYSHQKECLHTNLKDIKSEISPLKPNEFSSVSNYDKENEISSATSSLTSSLSSGNTKKINSFKLTSNLTDQNEDKCPENEFSRVRVLREMAESIQDRIDQETKRIKDFYDHVGIAEKIRSTELPAIVELKINSKLFLEEDRRNKAASKIQALWRGYAVRKVINDNLHYSVSEGSLSSDDECLKMPDNHYDNIGSDVQAFCTSPGNLSSSSSSFHDPYNFINAVSKKKVYVINKSKPDSASITDNDNLVTSFQPVDYQSDFEFSSKNVDTYSKGDKSSYSHVSKSSMDSYDRNDFKSMTGSSHSFDFKPITNLSRLPSESTVEMSKTTSTIKTSISGMESHTSVTNNSDNDISIPVIISTPEKLDSSIIETDLSIKKKNSNSNEISSKTLSYKSDSFLESSVSTEVGTDVSKISSNVMTDGPSNLENILSLGALDSLSDELKDKQFTISEGSLSSLDCNENLSVPESILSAVNDSDVRTMSMVNKQASEITSNLTSMMKSKSSVQESIQSVEMGSKSATISESIPTVSKYSSDFISNVSEENHSNSSSNFKNKHSTSSNLSEDVTSPQEKSTFSVINSHQNKVGSESVKTLELFQRKKQDEVNSFLQRITEQRMLAEQRLESQLMEHDKVLKFATESMAQVRQETNEIIQQNTQKLLVEQAKASQLTAEATKTLAEVLQGINYSKRKDAESQIVSSSTESHSTPISSFVEHSKPDQSIDSLSEIAPNSSSTIETNSNSTQETIPEEAVVVSTSPSLIVTEHVSSIQSSHVSNIGEEISEGDSVKYSMSFNESLTLEDKDPSHLNVPSTSNSKYSLRNKKLSITSSSSELDISANERASSMSNLKSKTMSSVVGGNSFEKFTMHMVKRYMKEGEVLAQRQQTLLKLREKALVEKTKAEIAWLELQKKTLKESGAEDQMPPLRKKQRGLVLRLQQERAELKRLKGVHKAAEQERQLVLRQQEEINKLHKTTKQIMDKIKFQSLEDKPPLKSLSQLSLASSVRTNRSKFTRTASNSTTQRSSSPSLIETDDNISNFDDSNSITEEVSSTPKSVVSDSKTITKTSSKEPENSLSVESFLRDLKQMKVSKRNLLIREKKLSQRKDTVEELMQWHQKLEKEEAEIRRKEKLILERIGHEKEKNQQHVISLSSEGDEEFHDEVLSVISKSFIEPTAYSSATISNIKTELNSHSNDEVMANDSIGEELSGTPLDTSNRHSTSALNDKSHLNDTSSIIKTDTSSKLSEKSNYSETFDSSSKRIQTSKSSKSKPCNTSPSESTTYSRPMLSIKTPLSPRSRYSQRHRDSSGSDDSFTVSLSETASDQSDIEGRVLALKEELRRRKQEADRLKHKQKKLNQERLRSQEASLRNQLEAYDKFILETTQELEKELDNDVNQLQKGIVKPQIKQPESRRLRRQNEINSFSSSSCDVSPPANVDDANQYFKAVGSESENLKSSSSCEEEKSSRGEIESFESSIQSFSSEHSVSEEILGVSANSSLEVSKPLEDISVSAKVSEQSIDVKSEEKTEPDNEVASKSSDFRDSYSIAEETYEVESDIDEVTDKILKSLLIETGNSMKICLTKQDHGDELKETTSTIENLSLKISISVVSEAVKEFSTIKKKDVKIPSPEGSPKSAVSQRVSSIMTDILERQTPPKDRHRPQDLMILSPLLLDDGDDLVTGDNFPFTDTFKSDVKLPVEEKGSDIEFKVELFDDEEWFDDDFGLGSKFNVSKKKQNESYSSCYYREIPNKPPPPYIAPKSGPYSIPSHTQSKVKKLMTIEPSSAVPQSLKEVNEIVKNVVSIVYAEFERGISVSEITIPDDYYDKEDLDIGIGSRSCHSYKTFLFNVVREITSGLLSAKNDTSKSGQRESFKSFALARRPKFTEANLIDMVQKEVSQLLRFSSKPVPRLVSGTGFNAVLHLGQKRRDKVDDILVHELREEEQDWICYDEDEELLKEQIVSTIFDNLVKDAIDVFREAEEIKKVY